MATTTTHKRERMLSPYGPYSTVHSDPVMLFWEKWRPRFVIFPILILGFVLYTVIYPVIALVSIVLDLVYYSKKKKIVFFRVFSFFLIFFVLEIVGVLGWFSQWAISWVIWPAPHTWRRWQNTWNCYWGKHMVFKSIKNVLGLRFDIEMPKDGIGSGPKIFLNRHASFVDTLLPVGIFSQDYELRYIVKKDLLWDPALNVAGARMPNFFLYREVGSSGLDVELQGVRKTITDVTPAENVIINLWPEGTRFSAKKRERILQSMSKKDPANYERAKKLQYTLLPRLGAALALLDANTCADVVFCSHVGLEPAAEVKEVLRGDLTGQVVKIKFEKVKFKDIPKGKDERTEWLFKHWEAIDAWVAQHQYILGSANRDQEKKQR